MCSFWNTALIVRVYSGEWLDHELIKFIEQTQSNLNENQWETAYEREQPWTKESVTYIVHKQF